MRYSTRKASTRKTLVRGSTLGAGVLLALALLVLVNYFGWKYHDRFDWTRSQVHSLSERTENVLAALEKPIEIVVFLTPSQGDPTLYEQVRDLVALYEAASTQISTRFMDPARNPMEFKQVAERFDLANPNVVVVASEDDKRILLGSELAQMDFSGGLGAAPSLAEFRGEQKVTAAILELAEERKPRVLFTTGHGESSLDDFGPGGLSSLSELFNLQNLEAEEWASLNQPAVPADADLVVIAGPTGTFLPPELEVLSTYAATGGRLLLLLDPELNPTGAGTGLREWLAGYGVAIDADVVIDPANRLPFFGADTFYVDSYGDHPATGTVRDEKIPVLLSLVRSVRSEADGDLSGDMPGDVSRTELLLTGADGWGERDLDALPEVGEDDADLAGPVPLGVVVEQEMEPKGDEDSEATESADEMVDGETDGESEAAEDESSGDSEDTAAKQGSERPMRLVVLGDSDFAGNQLLQSNAGNQIFLSDLLNWLVEREELTGIPSKQPEQVRLNLTRSQVNWVRMFSLALLPGASIFLGLWIWFRRRR